MERSGKVWIGQIFTTLGGSRLEHGRGETSSDASLRLRFGERGSGRKRVGDER